MDKLGFISTLVVYAGFIILPENIIIGIILILVSNIMWIYRGWQKKDWSVVMWQAGFVIINIRWLLIERG